MRAYAPSIGAPIIAQNVREGHAPVLFFLCAYCGALWSSSKVLLLASAAAKSPNSNWVKLRYRKPSAVAGKLLVMATPISNARLNNVVDLSVNSVFTTGSVGWPGVAHIADKDFAPLIEKALQMPGFAEDTDKGSVMVGFARNAVMGVADKVIEAVKSKAIRHFFLVGGCDGAKPGRNYYTEFVEKVPQDCVVLTLACGKFRFFDKDLGDIGGIPRLLDVGQCNDAYSAIQIAGALAGAFECGVNDLPLSMILSWYEQKAVSILLTRFHLGIKDIRLGPSLPPFVTPNVLKVLVDNFNIMPITTPDEDLKTTLG